MTLPALLLYAVLGGGLYCFPVNLIQVQGYTATAAGTVLLPFILITFGAQIEDPAHLEALFGRSLAARSGRSRCSRSVSSRWNCRHSAFTILPMRSLRPQDLEKGVQIKTSRCLAKRMFVARCEGPGFPVPLLPNE